MLAPYQTLYRASATRLMQPVATCLLKFYFQVLKRGTLKESLVWALLCSCALLRRRREVSRRTLLNWREYGTATMASRGLTSRRVIWHESICGVRCVSVICAMFVSPD